MFSLLLAPTPGAVWLLEFLAVRVCPNGMGRKSLQNVSNLCFGAKDASDLFINQRMAQAKENFIYSLPKFDFSSLELVFLWRNKNTYMKEAIHVCWLLSKAVEQGAQMQVLGWMDAQG